MNSTNLAWEKRSKNYGTKIEGVLPKFLPPLVNGYLDKWMYDRVRNYIFKKDNEIKVLDLGCGYGRLSEKILREFPKSKTFGIDVAQSYVDLYNKNLGPRGKANVGDIRKLPFKDNYFETVFMVTTLMYLVKKSDQTKAMKEIFRVLKPGGSFVFIERNTVGQSIVTVGGLVGKIRGQSNKEIHSVSFTKDKITKLIKDAGGNIDKTYGLPGWTLLLPFSMASNLVNKFLCRQFLKLVNLIDRLFSWLLTPSLYISYSGVKR